MSAMLNSKYTLFWKHRIFVKKRDIKYDTFVTIMLLRFKIIALSSNLVMFFFCEEANTRKTS